MKCDILLKSFKELSEEAIIAIVIELHHQLLAMAWLWLRCS